MEIIVNLDVMMAKRKISAGELAEKIGITPANLSILKIIKPRQYDFQRLWLCAMSLSASPRYS